MSKKKMSIKQKMEWLVENNVHEGMFIETDQGWIICCGKTPDNGLYMLARICAENQRIDGSNIIQNGPTGGWIENEINQFLRVATSYPPAVKDLAPKEFADEVRERLAKLSGEAA